MESPTTRYAQAAQDVNIDQTASINTGEATAKNLKMQPIRHNIGTYETH